MSGSSAEQLWKAAFSIAHKLAGMFMVVRDLQHAKAECAMEVRLVSAMVTVVVIVESVDAPYTVWTVCAV